MAQLGAWLALGQGERGIAAAAYADLMSRHKLARVRVMDAIGGKLTDRRQAADNDPTVVKLATLAAEAKRRMEILDGRIAGFEIKRATISREVSTRDVQHRETGPTGRRW